MSVGHTYVGLSSSAICSPASACAPCLSVRVCVIDPLRDSRWSDFVQRHPDAGLFHSTGWLEALRRTYGYEPLVVTTSQEDESLSNGIVLCRVHSQITGRRLVSLPFTDHCEPLVRDASELEVLIAFLKKQVAGGCYQYVEMRPLKAMSSTVSQRMCLGRDEAFCVHQLDLSPSLEGLYHRFHKSCVQRKLRRAEREGLRYEEGRSEELLSKFYRLLLQTRRRHQLPPQPMPWFRNLAASLGGSLRVRVASKDGNPIAAIITTHVRDTVVYKYGCSDAAHHNLGGMSLLIWRAIQDAKVEGTRCFDFGRSDQLNKGLLTFKEHWGAVRIPLSYHFYPAGFNNGIRSAWKRWLIQKTCACLPDPVFERVGTALYKHVG